MRSQPANDAPYRLINDVEFGENVRVHSFTNLYGCRIGDETKISTFVEIQRGAVIGARCNIQAYASICEGVTIEDEVFIGQGTRFTNDKRPRSTNEQGMFQSEDEWELLPTTVERRAALGSAVVVLPGVRIGAGALVGAGAVVTRDVEPGAVVLGNPARRLPASPRA